MPHTTHKLQKVLKKFLFHTRENNGKKKRKKFEQIDFLFMLQQYVLHGTHKQQ